MKKFLWGILGLGVIAGLVAVAVIHFSSLPPAGTPSVLELRFSLPQDYQFIKDAPYKLTCHSENEKVAAFTRGYNKKFTPFTAPFPVPFIGNPGKTEVKMTAVIYYCQKSTGMCFNDTFETTVPVTLQDTAPAAIKYVWNIWPKKPAKSPSPAANSL